MHILAGLAAIGALFDARHDDHMVAILAAILLHHHCIRAHGHRRTGEYPDRLASYRRDGGTAGRQFSLIYRRGVDVGDWGRRPRS